MPSPLGPLRFEPRLLPKPWGGRRLQGWGKQLPSQGGIGESWELYDDANGSSRVVRGPEQGRGLAELALTRGEDLYGTAAPLPAAFPLLVKLLDACENLSVQVHPGDALARAFHGEGARGKSEAWVVLDAAPGQRLLNGFKPGTVWSDVQRALKAGRVEELMNSVPVKVGDVLDVPAGRPHALMAGCLVVEVQQNSDWTYRLWDWGRLHQGQPRTLHLRQAEQALRFDAVGCGDGRVLPRPNQEPWGLREALVDGPYFSFQRWTLKPGAGPDLKGRLRILMALEGELDLAGPDFQAEARPLGPGNLVLVPAVCDCRSRAGSAGAVVLCVEPTL